jgi:hypothetical protein
MMYVVKVWDPSKGDEYTGLVSIETVRIRKQARADDKACREALVKHAREGLQAKVLRAG